MDDLANEQALEYEGSALGKDGNECSAAESDKNIVDKTIPQSLMKNQTRSKLRQAPEQRYDSGNWCKAFSCKASGSDCVSIAYLQCAVFPALYQWFVAGCPEKTSPKSYICALRSKLCKVGG